MCVYSEYGFLVGGGGGGEDILKELHLCGHCARELAKRITLEH